MAKIRVLLDYWDTSLHYEFYMHTLFGQSCVSIPVPHGTVAAKAVEPSLVTSCLLKFFVLLIEIYPTLSDGSYTGSYTRSPRQPGLDQAHMLWRVNIQKFLGGGAEVKSKSIL